MRNTFGSIDASKKPVTACDSALSTPSSAARSAVPTSSAVHVTPTSRRLATSDQLSPDDGYVSQECIQPPHASHAESAPLEVVARLSQPTAGLHSHSSSGTSHQGSHNDSDRSLDRSIDQSMTSASFVTTSTANTNSLTRPAPERMHELYSTCAQSTRARHVLTRGTRPMHVATPSPSDCDSLDLEQLLRDKDATIAHLRETMERNESAILQVCAEKEQNWEVELQDIHQEWERRWRHHQDKAFKMEQALLLQLFKLQQERKSLRAENEATNTEKEAAQGKLAECQDELGSLKVKVEELSWQVAQKSGEISLLKAQLRDSKELASHKGNNIVSIKTLLKEAQHSSDEKDHEILTLEAQLKLARQQLQDAGTENASLKSDVTTARDDVIDARKELEKARQEVDLRDLQLEMKCKELERCQAERVTRDTMTSRVSERDEAASVSPVATLVNSLRGEPTGAETPKDSPDVKTNATDAEDVTSLRAEFERERAQWLDEKNKVIRYQKRLQLNYVQMYRKNRALEADVQQLTLELEKRDVSLSGGLAMKEGEESMC